MVQIIRPLMLATCLVACSGAPRGDDMGRSDAAPFDVMLCDGRPAISAFRLIPDNAPIHHFEDKSCGESPKAVLIVNSSGDVVRIEAVGITAPVFESDSADDDSAMFRVSAKGLPRELAPEESLAIDVVFDAEVPDVYAKTLLVISTDKGCQKVPQIMGISAAGDTGGTLGPLFLDFGVLRPGEVSDPKNVGLTYLRNTSLLRFHLEIVATTAPEVFQVTKAFDDEVSGDCARASASVRMIAPSVSGPLDEGLIFETATTTPMGMFNGFGQIPLRGLVRE